MNRQSPQVDERARQLMMAVLDEESSNTERAELEQLLLDNPALEQEWRSMQRVKEVTATMKLKEPPAEVWDDYWNSAYNRVERGIGWILFSIGSIILLSFAAWKWVEAILGDTDLPVFLKVALFALVAGFVILGVSVLRQRIFTWHRDPYKEVKR